MAAAPTSRRIRGRGLVVLVASVFAVLEGVDLAHVTDGTRLGRGGAPMALTLDARGEHLAVAEFDHRRVVVGAVSPGGATSSFDFPSPPLELAWLEASDAPVVAFHYSSKLCRLPGLPAGGEPDCLDVIAPTLPEWKSPHSVLFGLATSDEHVYVLTGAWATWTRSAMLVRLRYDADDGWQETGRSEAFTDLPRKGYYRGFWPLMRSARTGEIYMAEPGTGLVRVFDDELRLLRSARVGHYASGLAIDELRSLVYLLDRRLDRIFVLDAPTLHVLAQIPVGAGPTDLALAPDGNSLWVAEGADDVVREIHLPDGSEVRRFEALRNPSALAFDRSHGRLFAALQERGEVLAWSTAPGAQPKPLAVARW